MMVENVEDVRSASCLSPNPGSDPALPLEPPEDGPASSPKDSWMASTFPIPVSYSLCGCGNRRLRRRNPEKFAASQGGANRRIKSRPTFDYSRYLSAARHDQLKKLQARMNIPFKPDLEEHEIKLRQYWLLSFSENTWARTSENWKSLGFQGTDPASDFRGAGLFGLQNLIFFARVYPEKYKKLVREGRDYGFAVAALNVTTMLQSYLQLTMETSQTKDVLFCDYVASIEALESFANLFDTYEAEGSTEAAADSESQRDLTRENGKLSGDHTTDEGDLQLEAFVSNENSHHLFEDIYSACLFVLDHCWFVLVDQYGDLAILYFREAIGNVYTILEDALTQSPQSVEELWEILADEIADREMFDLAERHREPFFVLSGDLDPSGSRMDGASSSTAAEVASSANKSPPGPEEQIHTRASPCESPNHAGSSASGSPATSADEVVAPTIAPPDGVYFIPSTSESSHSSSTMPQTKAPTMTICSSLLLCTVPENSRNNKSVIARACEAGTNEHRPAEQVQSTELFSG